MRRKDREVTDFNTIIKIIDECGVIRIGLADGDFPYIVPLNFAYAVQGPEICFYIHGAMAGKKYEMLKKFPLCSFEMDIPLGLDCIPEIRAVTMRYKCVMGKCKVDFLEETEKQSAMDIIMARNSKTKNFDYDREVLNRTAIAKLTVLMLSAKVNPVHE